MKMHYLRLLAVWALLAGTLAAQAQSVEPQENTHVLPGVILKANLLPLLGNSYNVSAEFGKGVNRTWMITAGVSAEPPGVDWHYRRAARLVVDRRYYLTTGARPGSGFYLGPYFRAVALRTDLEHEYTIYDSNYGYPYPFTERRRNDLIKLGLGVTVGYQMALKNGIVIDFMGGFGTNPALIKLNNERGRLGAEYYDGRLGVLIGGFL